MMGFLKGINLVFSKIKGDAMLYFLHFVAKTIYLKRENLYISGNLN
jgi:hypothetical protein